MRSRLVAPLLAALLIVAAGPAAAQDAATRLEATAPEPVLGWAGEAETARFEVALCYDEGGTNPSDGAFTIHVRVEAPPWVENSAEPETLSFATPPGEAEEAGCTAPETLDISFFAPDGIPPDETFRIEVHLIPDAEASETGTYALPENATTSVQVTTVPGPGDPRPPDNDDDATNDDDLLPGEDPDDPPPRYWPLILALLLLAAVVVVGAALMSGRRDRE